MFSPDPFGWHGQGRRTAEETLRLGVMYADGRPTATTAGYPRPSDDPAGQLVLTQGGGGGDEHSWRAGTRQAHPVPSRYNMASMIRRRGQTRRLPRRPG